MAPRRPSHLDVPPAASSSEEEEETSSDEEEEEEHPEAEAEAEASEDEEVQPTPKPSSVPSKKTDQSESDDESSSESEPGESPVKPIASKPMEDKKARSKPSVVATPEKKSSAKRPREAEDSKKRAKKKSAAEAPPSDAEEEEDDEEEEEPKKSGGDESKKLFQRLWSEEDEIVILNGMIDYTSKRGADPTSDMNAFHDFIKKLLHFEVSKVAQLTDKIRRLKRKYGNNAAKKKYNPTKPHEQKVFELSKKIWGGNAAEEPKSNGTATPVAAAKSSQKSNGKAKSALPAASKEGSKLIKSDEKASFSGSLSETIGIGMKSLPEHVLKKGLDLIPESKKAELDAKWKKLHIDELELFVRKNQLINEQVKMVLEKLKSSDH